MLTLSIDFCVHNHGNQLLFTPAQRLSRVRGLPGQISTGTNRYKPVQQVYLIILKQRQHAIPARLFCPRRDYRAGLEAFV